MNNLFSDLTVGKACLIGITAYSTYVVTTWLYYVVSTPSSNYRLVAAQKKGKVASVHDIPGPVGLPFVGPLFVFYPYVKKERIDLFVKDYSTKYNGIFKVKTEDSYMIFVDDNVMAKKIANSPDIFMRNAQLSEVLFDSVPTALFALPSGDTWKKHRKGLQPAFGPTHLRDAFVIALELVDQLLDIWENQPCRNVNKDFTMYTGEVIAKVAFSAELGALKSLTSESYDVDFFKHAELIATMANLRFGFLAYKFLWPLLRAGRKHVQPSADYIMNFLNKLIEERKIKHAQNSDKNWSTKDYSLDLLDRLLVPEANFTDEEIKSEVLGFFMAGHETTSNTLTWTLYTLAKHPHVYEKLAVEVEQVLGTEKPTSDSLSSLKYLDAVIKETMRIHSVVTFVVRETTTHCELTGSDGLTISIPPKVLVTTCVGTMSQHEKYWGEDAEVFNPDRWDNGFVPIPGSYLPFGDGPMSCIGQKMALIEAKVALIRIVQRFKKVSISPKQGAIEPITTLTHGLKHGLLIDLEKRSI